MEISDAIEISRVDNVFMEKGPRQAQLGSLCIFGHHLIFSPIAQTPGTLERNGHSNEEFWLLQRAVDRVVVEMKSKENPSKGGVLTLKCKNFMHCVFEVPSLDDCMALGRSIERVSNMTEIDKEYPFYYRCPFTVLDDGWTAFDVEQEYARLTVAANDTFRISSVNEGFKICPSYPEKLLVPRGIGDDYLKISATFRDGGRFPVLSYYHKPSKSSIMRCGQPLVGPTNRRCKEDETILNSLLTNSKGIIIDTRTKSVAAAAKSKGGGCESPQRYSQWRYINCPTPSIKEAQSALTRLVDVCQDRGASTDRWLGRLQASGWLQGVSDSLLAAANVAQCAHCEGTAEVPVVVHGGEGTDSTLLVTSLAQILLDPDARTIRGFESLIEREWICAGHPFRLRTSHSAYAQGVHTGPWESPIFLLFLDCVWQVMQQYPCSFELTEQLLVFLFEHAYASEFGSFLGNCEKDKADAKVKRHTVSLWSYVNNPEILRGFVNVLYEPNENVLWPSVAPQSINLWERVLMRWQKEWTEEDAVKAASADWRLREKELQSRAAQLRRQVVELTKELALQHACSQPLSVTD